MLRIPLMGKCLSRVEIEPNDQRINSRIGRSAPGTDRNRAAFATRLRANMMPRSATDRFIIGFALNRGQARPRAGRSTAASGLVRLLPSLGRASVRGRGLSAATDLAGDRGRRVARASKRGQTA